MALLERSIAERFMDPRHANIWRLVPSPEEVLAAIRTAPEWTAASRQFASLT